MPPNRKRLLVIEDNPGDFRLTEIHLREAAPEWEVASATTLAQALDFCAADRFDAILIDLNLPDAQGLKAIEAVRRANSEAALVVLTGYADERLADAAIHAGAQDYVVKGIDGLAMLGRVVRHAMDRQQAQAQLALAGQTAQALLDASHDLAVLLDADGLILTLNSAMAEYLGASADGLIGHDIFALLPETVREVRKAHIRRAIQTGQISSFEDSHDQRWFRNKVVAVGGCSSRVAVFCHDITAEHQAALQLALARDEALSANQSKTEFMGRMSREIRTHLNDVIGFSEMVSAGILGPIQPPVYGDYIKTVFDSGNQILKVIDRITDVTMLETALAGDETYRDLVELSPDFICVCKDNKIERINSAGLGLLRAKHADQVVGKDFAELVHPDYQTLFEMGLEALFEEDHPVPVKMLTLAGRVRDMDLNAVPLKRGGSVSTLVVGRDTTEISQAMRAVMAREQRIRAIMDTVQDGIVTTDEKGIITSANLAVERIFGYSLQKLMGASIGMLMPDLDASAPEKIQASFGHGLERLREGVEMAALRANGDVFPVHVGMSELRLDQTRLFVGTIRDLTENKKLAQKLDYLANHDSLTDLPNRTLFTERLRRMIAEHPDRQVAVIVVDLDDFSTINDTLGHDAGDTILRETARRLNQLMGNAGGVAGRLAGDEFAIAVGSEGHSCAISQMVEQLRTVLDHSYQVVGSELSLSASMGVSLYPRDGQDAAEVLRNAEMALHSVLREKDQSVGYFDANLSAAITSRLNLERDLKLALQRDEFELFYQPQVRLKDRRLVGCEALIRWHHPELGLVPPDRFIPLAEEIGLVVPMGQWVIEQACRQIAQWRKQGCTPLRVGVNISGRQFSGGELVAVVENAIRTCQVSPELLDLELTESMLMDDQKSTQAILEDLAALGVSLSIDDFGTGYSSLAYLKRFPVHTVKIDRAFVRDLDHDEDSRVIAEAIISMARLLSKSTIAEGVETDNQARILNGFGCDEIQGWLVAKPLPVAQFDTFVTQYAKTMEQALLPLVTLD